MHVPVGEQQRKECQERTCEKESPVDGFAQTLAVLCHAQNQPREDDAHQKPLERTAQTAEHCVDEPLRIETRERIRFPEGG